MRICKALLKHDLDNFSLSILEYCEPGQCLEREDYYIKLLKPEYNILQKAGSSLGIKRQDETRAKMSLAKKGENHPLFRKKREDHPLFGTTRSAEIRKK